MMIIKLMMMIKQHNEKDKHIKFKVYESFILRCVYYAVLKELQAKFTFFGLLFALLFSLYTNIVVHQFFFNYHTSVFNLIK